MEVARLEAVYTANTSGLDQASARAEARFKQTEAQAKKTEQAVNNAFRGSVAGDPLARLQAEFSARASRLRIDLSDIGGHANRIKQIDSQLKILDGQIAKTGGSIRRDLDGALAQVSPRLSSIIGAVGPLTAALLGVSAVAGVGAGMFQLAKSAAHAGDEIFDLTQKVNFSAETISALKNSGATAGVEVGAISAALGIFNKNVEAVNQGDKELSKTFKALKIDVRDNETALRSAFKALLNVEDGAQQGALAMQIFGRSGKEVLGIIKDTNGDLDAAIQKYRQLGTLITTETAKAANDFSDKLTLLEQKFDAVARSIGERFMPIVSRAMDDVNAALDKNKATAQNWATDLVSIVEFAATQIGHILEGLALVIEGFRKTFGEGSFFGDLVKSETRDRFLSLPDGRIMNLDTGQVRDVVGDRVVTRFDDAGEFAIAGGAGEFSVGSDNGRRTKRGGRLDISSGSGGGGRSARLDPGLSFLKQLEDQLNNLLPRTELLRVQDKLLDDQYKHTTDSIKKRIMVTAIEIDLMKQRTADFDSEVRLVRELGEKGEQGFVRARTASGPFIEDLEKLVSLVQELGEKGERGFQRMSRFAENILRNTRPLRAGIAPEGSRDVIDLGGGSVALRPTALTAEELLSSTRNRITSIDDLFTREQRARRIESMREVAEDLGSIFGDAFGGIQDGWDNMWRNMARTAQDIGRRIVEDLVTGLFSRAFNLPMSESRSGGLVGLITNPILSAFGKNRGGGSSVGGLATNIAGGLAEGGTAQAGLLYQVNERQQEYFMSRQTGTVFPLSGSNQGFDLENALSQAIARTRGSESMRLAIVDDLRSAREWRADRVLRLNKQMRKIGKIIPGA